MQRALVALVIAAQLAAASPSPGQTRAPMRDATVPFAAGETLTFDVTWSTFLVAGSAVSRIESKRPDGYVIVADGQPIPLLRRLYDIYYRMDSVLDSVTLLPHRTGLLSQESGVRRETVMRFDRARRKASYELKEDGNNLDAEIDVPPQVQDGLSALYVLRAMTLKTGDRITLPVADDGQLYSVQADAVGLEQVRVPLGSQEAWRVNVTILDVEGQPAASDAAVWISNDARRLPVKLQAKLPVGHFVLLLREAR
jgi:hypothetical protein